MLPLRGGLPVFSLLTLLAALVSALPTAAGLSACPSLAVEVSTSPTARKQFGVTVKVRNIGSAALQNVGLRVTVPLNVTYDEVKVQPPLEDGSAQGPVFLAPYVYWPGFSLKAGKARTFRLEGKVAKCQDPGTFALQAAAYQLSANCSTSTGPERVGVGGKEKVDYCHAEGGVGGE